MDSEGWEVGFADLPADYDPSIYELDSGHRALPEGLESAGIYIQGHNRSDDLFMFLKRRVDGLVPMASYEVAVELASTIGVRMVGHCACRYQMDRRGNVACLYGVACRIGSLRPRRFLAGDCHRRRFSRAGFLSQAGGVETPA